MQISSLLSNTKNTQKKQLEIGAKQLNPLLTETYNSELSAFSVPLKIDAETQTETIEEIDNKNFNTNKIIKKFNK